MVFVNPYTFIGFPSEVRREKPIGHAPTREEAKALYSGTLRVKWRLASPLAIPADGSWGLGEDNKCAGQRSAEIRIPGASVKGAVRSVHEALFAGCLRIVDPEYTPVYRDLMSTALTDGWRFAVVMTPDVNVENDDGATAKVMLCGDVGWVDGADVKKAFQDLGRLPRTGDFVQPEDRPDGKGRKTYRSVTNPQLADRGDNFIDEFKKALDKKLSVILVTDTAARDDKKPYYWAAAQPNEKNGLRVVSRQALRSFRQKLRGARHDSPAFENDSPAFENVYWPPPQGRGCSGGEPVAQRRSVDGWLRRGDVIWVKLDDRGCEVIDIKLSLGWRSPAGGKRPKLRDRVPERAMPCHEADRLCLSCTVFGSIDPNAKTRDDGRQDSYGGHVRFGDAIGNCNQQDWELDVELAPLGTPHPGAGMYYLTPITAQEMRGKLERPDLPTRWDSVAGELKPRNLRGRKFYWHSDPEKQKREKHLPSERFRRQQEAHQNEENIPKVHLVKKAELQQTIAFDCLDAIGLASLLAALNPALLLGQRNGPYGLHLGRGKPLGLGSVTTEVELKMTTTADRYADNPPELTELPDLRTVLEKGIPQRCGANSMQAIAEEARKVLSLTGLGEQAAEVSYPTCGSWSEFGTPAFHESFKFFQQNSGQVREKRPTGGSSTGKNRQHGSRGRGGIKKKPDLGRGPWAPLPLAIDQQGQECAP